jgi:hypothetical protein
VSEHQWFQFFDGAARLSMQAPHSLAMPGLCTRISPDIRWKGDLYDNAAQAHRTANRAMLDSRFGNQLFNEETVV